MIRAFRITQTRHLTTAFSGECAKLYGGRWNSIGTPMIYTAGSLSLATLELLVHVEEISTLHNAYSVIPVTLKKKSQIECIAPDSLPIGWDAPELISATQLLGDAWIASASSVALQVPSAVIPTEPNILLNPAHPDFSNIIQEAPFSFELDPRLQ